MSFFSAIVADILVSSAFVLLVPAVGGSVGASFTPITPPPRRMLIPLVSSLIATSSSSSSLLGVECLGDHIRFGCYRSIRLAFIECLHHLLNRKSCARLKDLDHDCIGRRKSRVDVILEDHIGDYFFRASELSGDIKHFSDVGIEWLSRSGTKSAEFPKERHSSDGGVGSVCAYLQLFPYLNRIVYAFDEHLDSIGPGTVNDRQSLQFPLLVVLIPLQRQDRVSGEVVGSSWIFRFFFLLHHNVPSHYSL